MDGCIGLELGGSGHIWQLRLYVAGVTRGTEWTVASLRSLCDVHLNRNYVLKVIDLLESPHLAEDDGIIAVPTLIRNAPLPARRVIGDLSNKECILYGLGIDVACTAGVPDSQTE